MRGTKFVSIIKKYLPARHHRLELIVADFLICLLSGFGAFLFDHGLIAFLDSLKSLEIILPVYSLFYVIGFISLRTYNSFNSNWPYLEFLKCSGAVIIAAVLIVGFRMITGFDTDVFEPRDITLQALFALIGMVLVRVAVKMHFVFYSRRSSDIGMYGLNDIALLNMEMKELLQRKPIEINKEEIASCIEGRTILITGAAGSIGSELSRLIIANNPKRLIIIDQAETPLYNLKIELGSSNPFIETKAIVTNVCHSHRLEHIFNEHKPEIVFHAAAYKHVPMMEENVVESILNNVDATVKLADASVRHNVQKFILISTDKAVNPTNVMGCSKRICEIYCQSLSHKIGDNGTQFITTRFGNVLGSNGSVVPFFREQIRRGGPVTVTHPDIIRYFMLIPEACSLVLEAALIGKGGEVLAFDMGEPVRIADMARKMISLSGKKDVRIVYTGLRKGEKLFEEVFDAEEVMKPTKHDKIKIARVREYEFDKVVEEIKRLIQTALEYDTENIIRIMVEFVPEFKPQRNGNFF